MCGRYTRRATRQAVAEHFGLNLSQVPAFIESWNIAPQTFQPVVRLGPDGRREMALMRWGFVPFWAKDTRSSIINAKAEDVDKKSMWREAFKRRRCLVPADAFYEWQKLDAKAKQPYAIALTDGGLYSFAGLWGSRRECDGFLETFAIITTEANSLVAPLHDRMPVILVEENYERWLDTSDPGKMPLDLLRPFPVEIMRAWRVAKDVGNVRHDRPDLIKPI